VAPGDVYIDNNNLENWSTGVSFLKASETSGGANHITNNDFFNNTEPLSLGDGNANWLLDISVTGNQFYWLTVCVQIINSVNNVTIVGNTFNVMSGTPTGINITGNAVLGIAATPCVAALPRDHTRGEQLFIHRIQGLAGPRGEHVPLNKKGCDSTDLIDVDVAALDNATVTGLRTARCGPGRAGM
jgi:hypothetical protein